MSKEVAELIPSAHYELIQEVNVARNNLLLTKVRLILSPPSLPSFPSQMHLEQIISIPYAVESAKILMETDDINILDVHAEVRRLERVRSKILDSVRSPHLPNPPHLTHIQVTNYPQQRAELTLILANIVELAEAFDRRIESLLMSHHELAQKRPAVLIKVLQVIVREKKQLEAMKAYEKEKSLKQAASSPPSNSATPLAGTPLEGSRSSIPLTQQRTSSTSFRPQFDSNFSLSR